MYVCACLCVHTNVYAHNRQTQNKCTPSHFLFTHTRTRTHTDACTHTHTLSTTLTLLYALGCPHDVHCEISVCTPCQLLTSCCLALQISVPVNSAFLYYARHYPLVLEVFGHYQHHPLHSASTEDILSLPDTHKLGRPVSPLPPSSQAAVPVRSSKTTVFDAAGLVVFM